MIQHKAAVGQNMPLYTYIQNTGFQVVRLKSDNSHPGVIHISGTKEREREIHLISRLCSEFQL